MEHEGSATRENSDSVPTTEPSAGKLGLRPLGTDIWEVTLLTAMKGLPLGNRSVIVRLSAGGLWLHAPGPGLDRYLEDIAALGKVTHITVPNLFHNLAIEALSTWFPNVPVSVPPGLAGKLGPRYNALQKPVSHASFADVLSPDIAWCEVAGQPKIQETVFFHIPSRTLILTDLAFNVRGGGTWLQRQGLKLAGCHNRFGPSRFAKFLTKNPAAYGASLGNINQWPFEQIIPCHGAVLKQQAKAAFGQAFGAWL